MNKFLFIRKLCLFLIFGSLYLPTLGQEHITINYSEAPQGSGYDLYPNAAGNGIMTPSGFGSTIPFVFGAIGGLFPAGYSNKNDLVASAGVGFGSSRRNVGFVGIVNMIDVSKGRNFSASFKLSRYLGSGTSVSIGGINMFASKDPKYANDGFASYYVAVSHASQSLESKTPGFSALTYGLGVGSGIFYIKSRQDSLAGRGTKGTAVFGNIAYEVLKGINVIAEWSGLNLSCGLGIRPSFKWPALRIAVADLTRFSRDKPRLTMGLAYALAFSKN